jgi:superfamily II DNA or RNA helicase
MDIPQARICIVLASTGNPTQFIQRRGRVLRVYSESYKDGSKKTHADIYDILVKPQIDNFDDPDSIKLELGMIRSQLSRIRLMSELALNKTYCMNKIQVFTYGLPPESF